MNYDLNKLSAQQEKVSTLAALKKLLELIRHERRVLWLALIAILINSGVNLVGPLLIGHAIDKYVIPRDYHGCWSTRLFCWVCTFAVSWPVTCKPY